MAERLAMPSVLIRVAGGTWDVPSMGSRQPRSHVQALRTLMLAACMALVGAGSATAVEVQSEKAAREDCSGNSQAGTGECLAKKAAESRETLKAAGAAARAAIGRWYEDAKYARQAAARL